MVRDDLEKYYDSEINNGQLYPSLDSLVEKGLVEKGQRNQRTNYYTLTRRGQREIDARRDWEAQQALHILLGDEADERPSEKGHVQHI